MPLKVVPPDARCDTCRDPVELSQIHKSRVNGVPVGPWLCVKCEQDNSREAQAGAIAHQHKQMTQNNYFDSICNQADPMLAEAIHRAGRS